MDAFLLMVGVVDDMVGADEGRVRGGGVWDDEEKCTSQGKGKYT